MIDEPTTILVIFIEMKPHRKLLFPEIKPMTLVTRQQFYCRSLNDIVLNIVMFHILLSCDIALQTPI
jgi:hypothetical protein